MIRQTGFRYTRILYLYGSAKIINLVHGPCSRTLPGNKVNNTLFLVPCSALSAYKVCKNLVHEPCSHYVFVLIPNSTAFKSSKVMRLMFSARQSPPS